MKFLPIFILFGMFFFPEFARAQQVVTPVVPVTTNGTTTFVPAGTAANPIVVVSP